MNGFFIAAICIAMIILTILLITSVLRYETRNTIRHNAVHVDRRYEPSITLIVYARTPPLDTPLILTHSIPTSIKNIELIIINTNRHSNTRTLLKKIKKQYPTMTIHGYTTKRDPQSALPAAYRRYGHGKYVLALSGGHRISTNSLRRASLQLENNPKITAIRYNQVPLLTLSSVAIMQAYAHIFVSLFHRAQTVFHKIHKLEYIEEGIMYRKHQFTIQTTHLKSYSALYLHSAVINTLPANTIWSYICTRYRAEPAKQTRQSTAQLLLSLGSITIGTYLLVYGTYLAFIARQPILLLAMWGFASGIILFILWIDENFNYRRKLLLTFLLPLIIPFGYGYVALKIASSAVQFIRYTTPLGKIKNRP